jgi:hypothetical protein
MYKKNKIWKRHIPLALVAVAAGLGLAWVARRRSQEIGGLPTWQNILAEKYGAAKAQQLAGQIRLRHAALLAQRPLPANAVLRRHVTGSILPGLALYQALLQEHNDDQQAALADVDAALRAWTLAKNRLLMFPFKVFPNSFWLFRLAFSWMMKKFPAEGWDFAYVEDSADRIAFDGTRCFYLNTLTSYGAPELTASFCKTDEVMAELFPPTIRFVREHTLGRGDEVCDFQYCHVKQDRRNQLFQR